MSFLNESGMENKNYELHLGDSAEILKTLPAESIDCLITDPPCGISFMGHDWDSDKGGREEWIAWLSSILAEALRTLKPGSHALVWALPRTSHWTATAIEDAGFEIRDIVSHHFGNGFPKSPNAIKPATEFWILARKPLAESIEANIEAHGTGGLQIEACRIGTERIATCRHGKSGAQGIYGKDDRILEKPCHVGRWPANLILSHSADCQICDGTCSDDCPLKTMDGQSGQTKSQRSNRNGKPGEIFNNISNVVEGGERGYDDSGGASRFFYCPNGCAADCPIRQIDEQSGKGKSRAGVAKNGGTSIFGKAETCVHDARIMGYDDSGGASRFFYCPKASKSERNAGLEDRDEQPNSGGLFQSSDPTAKRNSHPTVKPIKLMRYLCRLITPPDGIILDCFLGSGTSGIAALQEGFRFIGIEKEPEYLAIAKARIEAAEAERLAKPFSIS